MCHSGMCGSVLSLSEQITLQTKVGLLWLTECSANTSQYLQPSHCCARLSVVRIGHHKSRLVLKL